MKKTQVCLGICICFVMLCSCKNNEVESCKNDLIPTPVSQNIAHELMLGGAEVTPTTFEMLEQKVSSADSQTDLVLIDQNHFSDSYFRKFLLQQYDKNRDGFLSREERDCVTSIYWDVSEHSIEGEGIKSDTTLDGLDWFRNLETLCVVNAGDVYLKNHPSIRYLGGGEGRANFWIENCECLEEMGFSMFDGTLYVSDCKRLSKALFNDTEFSAIHFSETPLLEVQMDTTNLYPTIFHLDSDAYFSPGVHSELSFRLSDEERPEWVLFDEKYQIDWLNSEDKGDYVEILDELVIRTQRYLEKSEPERVEEREISTSIGLQKGYAVYFSDLGNDAIQEWDYPRDMVEVVTENEINPMFFSFEVNDWKSVKTIRFSPNKGFILEIKVSATVFYLENGVINELGDILAVSYFVKNENGDLVEYRSLSEMMKKILLEE